MTRTVSPRPSTGMFAGPVCSLSRAGMGPRTLRNIALPLSAIALLSACDPVSRDIDLRGLGQGFDTSQAANSAAATKRPAADSNGVISYPGYQVALARNGETVQQVADRLGVSAAELARYNGLKSSDQLRRDELLALPERLDSTSAPQPAAPAPNGAIDITSLASGAIDRSPASPTASAPVQTQLADGPEPIRHKVARGETAFTISRLYNVSVRALAEWNSLDRDFTVREGQVLLIPVPSETNASATTVPSTPAAPGTGSPTPTPPSASTALPEENPTAAAEPVETPPAPVIKQSTAPAGRLAYPVKGNIVRDYQKGKNEGIDIAASAGTNVAAADDGTVAAITADANQVPIVVIKHANNLLTVYAYIDDLAVQKGDAVKRGQTIAKVRAGSPAILHFEVRDGFDSVDPTSYLNG